MNALFQDLKFGLRMLAKNPGFTAVAVLTLALGIGANSTIFSWINSTLLNPIPGVAHTSDLVTVMRGERSEHPTPPFSYLDYLDLREHTQSFSGLLAYHDDFMSLTGTDKPERIYGALTSANYFDVLGVHPILGRGFLPAEEQRRGGGPVVVISESLWRARFSSDRSIIGKAIQIDRYLYTVVGVAPPDFHFGRRLRRHRPGDRLGQEHGHQLDGELHLLAQHHHGFPERHGLLPARSHLLRGQLVRDGHRDGRLQLRRRDIYHEHRSRHRGHEHDPVVERLVV